MSEHLKDCEIKLIGSEKCSCDSMQHWEDAQIRSLIIERDALKADVEEERRHYNEAAAIRDDALVAMSKAESRAAKYKEALEKITRSASCIDDHMSFNTPEQMCDQRIAQEALREEKCL